MHGCVFVMLHITGYEDKVRKIVKRVEMFMHIFLLDGELWFIGFLETHNIHILLHITSGHNIHTDLT